MSQADIAFLRQEYIRQSTAQRWGEAAAVAVLLGFEPIAGDDRLARHASRGGSHGTRSWPTEPGRRGSGS